VASLAFGNDVFWW